MIFSRNAYNGAISEMTTCKGTVEYTDEIWISIQHSYMCLSLIPVTTIAIRHMMEAALLICVTVSFTCLSASVKNYHASHKM
jgi:hypothetical protein